MPSVAMPSVDEPFSLIIFGASGDLTRRKLVPALWSLYAARTLPEPFAIVAVARTQMSHEEFRRRMRDAITEFARIQPPSENVWERFASALFYLSGDPTSPELYLHLEATLAHLESARPGEKGPANRLFYCATPPSLYDDIIQHIGSSGLARQDQGWRRIIIEKPFGHDYESGRALNRQLAEVFSEDQVYRIDHYLGKETVQNLLVFRFANGIFEPIWNRNLVAEVQITVAESIGVETRGSYYEEAGALRDMMQNHLLQLLCLIAMEAPVTFEAERVREEKNKVLQAIRPIEMAHIDEVALRGQYGPGFVANRPVPGYRQEKGVAPDSATETYVALKLQVDNWRWAGVPFFLRTGKRLAEGQRIISIAFREPPKSMFPVGSGVGAQGPDHLTFDLADAAKMSLSFYGKRPGPGMRLDKLSMQFAMRDTDMAGEVLEAYERLILDVMRGDRTLFTTAEGIERLWEVSTPLLEAPSPMRLYHPGSWGPNAVHQLIAPHAWRLPFERTWRDPNKTGS